ncbi:MAG: carboxypeptidase regulatory-like domain-containing protein [Bacteroidota bacterium]
MRVLHTFLVLVATSLTLLPTVQAGTISGTVVDDEGQPLSGIAVSLSAIAEADSAVTFNPVITGEDGAWQFDVPQTGQYIVEAFQPALGLTVARAVVELTAADQIIEGLVLTIRPHGDPFPDNRVAGVVVDATDGLPLAFAQVILTADDGVVYRASSGADGSFLIQSIEPLTYTVTVLRVGYALFEAEAPLEITEDTQIDDFSLALERTFSAFASLSGQLVEQDGTLITTPTQVYVIRLPNETADQDSVGEGLWLFEDVFSTDGTFAFERLVPGSYVVAAEVPGFEADFIEVTLADGEATTLDLVLYPFQQPPTTRISGQVLDATDQQPIPDATGSLSGDPMEVAYQFVTDEEGRFSVTGVLPQSYDLSVSAEGYTPLAPLRVEIPTDSSQVNDLTLQLERTFTAFAEVNGIVRDAATQAPLADAHVYIVNAEVARDDTGTQFRFQSTTTGPDGRYAFDRLIPDTYLLGVGVDGYDGQSAELELADGGQATQDFDLSAFTVGTIIGQAVFEDLGLPATGVRFTLIPVDSSANTAQEVVVDADNGGYFGFDAEAGTYVLLATVSAPDGTVIYEEYFEDAETLDEATPLVVVPGQFIGPLFIGLPAGELGNGVTVSGRVVDEATGEVLPRAQVRVATGWGRGAMIRTTTDEQGAYTFSVPAFLSEFVLSASAEGFETRYYPDADAAYLAEPITISPDGELSVSDLTLFLPPSLDGVAGGRVEGQVTGVDGTILEEAQVLALTPAGDLVGATTPSREGLYGLSNLEPGPYYILAVAPGYLPSYNGRGDDWESVEPLTVRSLVEVGSIPLDFRLEQLPSVEGSGVLSGQIQMATDATSVRGAVVSLHYTDGSMVAVTFSDLSGGYSFPNLAPDTYLLRAMKVGLNTQVQTVEVNGQMDDSGNGRTVEDVRMAPDTDSATSTEAPLDLPREVTLGTAYPNPFNPTTTIPFTLPETGAVTLQVYDALGQRVATLVDEVRPAGAHTVRFEGLDLPSGLYLYRLSTPQRTLTSTMLLVK